MECCLAQRGFLVGNFKISSGVSCAYCRYEQPWSPSSPLRASVLSLLLSIFSLCFQRVSPACQGVQVPANFWESNDNVFAYFDGQITSGLMPDD